MKKVWIGAEFDFREGESDESTEWNRSSWIEIVEGLAYHGITTWQSFILIDEDDAKTLTREGRQQQQACYSLIKMPTLWNYYSKCDHCNNIIIENEFNR